MPDRSKDYTQTNREEREKKVEKYLKKHPVQQNLFPFAGSVHGVQGTEKIVCETLVAKATSFREPAFMVQGLTVPKITAEISIITGDIVQTIEAPIQNGFQELSEKVQVPAQSVIRVRVHNAEPFVAHSIYFTSKMFN